MVSKGTIIKVNFDPQKGHEQAGYRPALVVSADDYNAISNNMVIACPITNSRNNFPLHIPLDSRTKTTGVVLCEHIRSLDLNSRRYDVVEKIPDDLLENVVGMISLLIQS